MNSYPPSGPYGPAPDPRTPPGSSPYPPQHPAYPPQPGSSRQAGEPPQYSGYGQFGPPPQYPAWPDYAPPNTPLLSPKAPLPRSALPLILGGIVAVIVAAAVLAVLVLHPFGGSGIAGTWYGSGTVTVSNGTRLGVATYLDLSQNGSQVSGTGQYCVSLGSTGTATLSLNVAGMLNGTALSMTWTPTSTNTNESPTQVSGSVTNNQITLTTISGDASNLTLSHGSQSSFTSGCNALGPAA